MYSLYQEVNHKLLEKTELLNIFKRFILHFIFFTFFKMDLKSWPVPLMMTAILNLNCPRLAGVSKLDKRHIGKTKDPAKLSSVK